MAAGVAPLLSPAAAGAPRQRGPAQPSAAQPSPPPPPRPLPANGSRLPHGGGDVTSAARAPRPSSRARAAVSRAQTFAVGWPGAEGRGGGGTGQRSRSGSTGSAVLARPPRAEAARGMSVPRAAAAAASSRAPAGGQRARLPARSLQRERSE